MRPPTDAYATHVYHEVEGRKHVHADQQVVGVGLILPSSVTLGYKAGFFHTQPLLRVDGTDVFCLGDLLLATQRAVGPFIVFEFGSKKKLVLQLAAAREATAKLMAEHGIASDASAGAHEAAKKGFLPVPVKEGGGDGRSSGAAATP